MSPMSSVQEEIYAAVVGCRVRDAHVELVDVEWRSEDLGETAMHRAAAAGYVEGICVLAEQCHALVEARSLGWRPLHAAAFEGKAEAVRTLIQCPYVFVSQVAALLEVGCEVEAGTERSLYGVSEGTTALKMARDLGHGECARVLAEATNRAISERASEARSLEECGDVAGALRLYEGIPGSEAEARAVRERLEARIEELVQDARKLIERDEFEAAFKTLQQGTRDHGRRPALIDALREVRAAEVDYKAALDLTEMAEAEEAESALASLTEPGPRTRRAAAVIRERQRTQSRPPRVSYPTRKVGVFDKIRLQPSLLEGRPKEFVCSDLPDGLKLDSKTGVVCGAVRGLGDLKFTVAAINDAGTCVADVLLNVDFNSAPRLTRKTLSQLGLFREEAPFSSSRDDETDEVAVVEWLLEDRRVTKAAEALRTGAFDFVQDYGFSIDDLMDTEVHAISASALVCVVSAAKASLPSDRDFLIQEAVKRLADYAAREPAQIEPAFILAAARLQSLWPQPHLPPATLLARLYAAVDLARPPGRARFLDASPDLFDDAAIFRGTKPASSSSSSSSRASPRASPSRTKENSDWDRRKAHVPTRVRNALKPLMEGMAGLEDVKAAALAIYDKVVKDRTLRAAARVPVTLNFTLLGAPGTGKTTVGRVIGKLLHAVGARESDAFVELKAQQALAAGEDVMIELIDLMLHPPPRMAKTPPPPDPVLDRLAAEIARIGRRQDNRALGGQLDRLGDLVKKRNAENAENNADSDDDFYDGFDDSDSDDDATAPVASPPQQTRPSQPTRPRPRPSQQRSPPATVARTRAEALLKKALLRGSRKAPNGKPGGVLFIDEAHALAPKTNSVGRAIFRLLMDAAEDYRFQLTIILAGYKDKMEQELYGFDVGMKSRFSDVVFADYTEPELRDIWDRLVESYADDEVRWEVANEVATTAVRRVARSRGLPGFGNGRDVRGAFERAASKASARPDFDSARPVILMEDVLGPRPSPATNARLRDALADLDRLEGLDDVKRAVADLLEVNATNYDREARGDPPFPVKKHRIFWGNPGCGKTTVAAIYGRLLNAMGLVSSGDVLLKTAGDFVGTAVGESQNKTAAILELARGKVLVIDEAYNLDDNLYGKQVLDTIVEKVSGSPTEDLAVVLAGYEKNIRKMLREQNPGLASRFDPSSAFAFKDYDDCALGRVFRGKCAKVGVAAAPAVVRAAVRRLAKKRNLPNFGNVREVETLVAVAQAKAAVRGGTRLVLEDVVDAEESAAERDPKAALDALFNVAEIRQHIEKLEANLKVRRREGMDLPRPANYVFSGNSGTGKTTVARVMGQILHAQGLLASATVVEKTAAELKGAFVGHAQKEVRAAFEEAQGGVLFVDEAYALGSGDTFSREAVTELIACMTSTTLGATTVILAGYEEDMNAMLQQNQGLRSRFNKSWTFKDWSAADCAAFVAQRATADNFAVSDATHATLVEGFDRLRYFVDAADGGQKHPRPGFANARDATQIYSDILEIRAMRVLHKTEEQPTIEPSDARQALEDMLAHRPAGYPSRGPSVPCGHPLAATYFDTQQSRPPQQQTTRTRQQHAQPHLEDHQGEDDNDFEQLREDEPGCADEEAEAERERAQMTQDEIDRQRVEEETAQDDARDKMQAELEDVLKKINQAKFEKEIQEAEAKRKEIERQLEIQRRLEELRTRMPCPAGFAWRHEGNGYRCLGGSHFVPESYFDNHH